MTLEFRQEETNLREWSKDPNLNTVFSFYFCLEKGKIYVFFFFLRIAREKGTGQDILLT